MKYLITERCADTCELIDKYLIVNVRTILKIKEGMLIIYEDFSTEKLEMIRCGIPMTYEIKRISH